MDLLVLAMSVFIIIDVATAGNDAKKSSYGIGRPIRYRWDTKKTGASRFYYVPSLLEDLSYERYRVKKLNKFKSYIIEITFENLLRA